MRKDFRQCLEYGSSLLKSQSHSADACTILCSVQAHLPLSLLQPRRSPEHSPTIGKLFP